MRERGLEPDPSPAAEAEARGITGPATESHPSIKDLRDLPWCAIDNDDSRDIDQLSVAEVLPKGAVKVLVAVADVDCLVKKGSALDLHAQTNTTSVYTAAEIFPMLPEKLSTDFTSLNADQERLALVMEMVVAPTGAVTESSVYRARVLNRAQLAYDSVASWLDGTAPAPPALAAVPALEAQLRLQDKTAQCMRAVRFERGALNLETLEAKALFDGDTLAALRPSLKNRAKELIEDFMIGANGATATFLAQKGLPVLRRVLRSPERWERIVALAAEMGERLPEQANALALAEFLARRKTADPLRFPDVSLAVVKLLGSGEYAVQLPGRHADEHFGLAVRDYTHSTAPNRRFPDLATQRLLKAALAARPSPYADAELVALAAHCTEQEDDASKVERQVRKSAAALLLSNRTGARFDAIVTGASAKGTWVRILDPAVEGKLQKGFEGLDVGDRLKVELVRTDVERGYIDFVRVR
jgi:VacB/RNase II family 3'-5' exoribonuclease